MKTSVKYIITESKLDEVITNYLDELFDVKNIDYTHMPEYDDEDGWNENENVVVFYFGDFGDEDTETCFTWYGKQYWIKNRDMSHKCPVVDIEREYYNQLDGYFGDKWKESFKKWFIRNFEYPIKTVERA
jgi:hypothetical protein